jgi:hypothetical protein
MNGTTWREGIDNADHAPFFRKNFPTTSVNTCLREAQYLEDPDDMTKTVRQH